ncbi:hypothetical protein F5Y06DRAFT_258218 [Hypoxylon sp. FL0890]|nr:hypothetical protein F5Y06DRAFT_258218 [Hypoxylon sp. FL0890]
MRPPSMLAILFGFIESLIGRAEGKNDPGKKDNRSRRFQKARPRGSSSIHLRDESPDPRGKRQHVRGWQRRPTSVCSTTHPAGDKYEMELPPAPLSYKGPPRPQIIVQEPTPTVSPRSSVAETSHHEESQRKPHHRTASSILHPHVKDGDEEGHKCMKRLRRCIHHHHHYHHHHVHYHGDGDGNGNGQKPKHSRGHSTHAFNAEAPTTQSHLHPNRRYSSQHNSQAPGPRLVTVPTRPIVPPVVELPKDFTDTSGLAARRKDKKTSEATSQPTIPPAATQDAPKSILKK